jgi:DNA-directed RNA polymerase specialized sigma24 family protein
MDMDRGVRGWLLNTCKENYWRVAGWYDFEDLIQDGMLHYVRVSNKYPHVTSQKHLGALFRTAFTNHIHDLSKRRSRIDCEINECLLGVPIAEVESVANTQPDTSLIMAQLPPILRSLLNTLQDDPRAYRRFRRRLDGTRETNNDHLCRLIGLDPTSTGDVLQSLHRHLIGRPPKIAV